MTSQFDFELQNYARQGKEEEEEDKELLYPSIVKGETRKNKRP
jgi:hypothetical protein